MIELIEEQDFNLILKHKISVSKMMMNNEKSESEID